MSSYVAHPLIYPETVEDRLYQRRILEAGRDRNLLVILPTALGKTVISAIAAADILHNYRESRILVMAPTRPLVLQHRETFRRLIRLPEESFAVLTGKTSAEYRMGIWAGSARIIFATPEVVRNDILRQGLKLSSFGLIIVDECHRAVKEYAYTEVCSSYVKDSPYPLILGLTASPGSNIERVESVCEALSVEHVEYRNDFDPDVKPYINPINVEWKTVNLPREYSPLRRLLREMLESKIRALQQYGHFRKDAANITRKDLIELGSELRYNVEMSIEEERSPIYHAISLQSQALTLFHMLELLETQGTYTLKAFMERMEEDGKRSRTTLLKDGRLKLLLEEASKAANPKISTIKETVKKQLTENPNSRILVFTQYRDTAKHLVETLNTIQNVKAERFVGQASKLGDKGLTQEEQTRLIGKLREGTINILCATSIAEEGLDIPEVNLVIFYEPIPSEIRYIQRRGRTGRKTPGRVVIIAADNTNDIIYRYASERRTRRMASTVETLNRRLKPKLRLREKPPVNPLTEEEIRTIWERTGPKPPPKPIMDYRENLRKLKRTVEKARRTIYLKLLETGMEGAEINELYRRMEEEGCSREIARTAIRKMINEKYISETHEKISIPAKPIPGTKILTVEIERLQPGLAIVRVNGKYMARLTPENYEGPRELLKKHKTFKALGSLYHLNGKLNITIRQIIQTDIKP